MPSTQALCVRVLWGERRISTHLLQRGESLPLTPLGERAARATAPLRFDADAQGFHLGFHEGVTGELLRNGETPLALGDTIHRGLATEDGQGWRLKLGHADVVRVGRGAVCLEAFRVNAPRKAPVVLDVDYRFLNTLLVCLALFFGLAVQAQLTEVEEESDATSDELTRMRHILVKAAEPPPKKRAAPATEATSQPTKRRATAEGAPRSVKKPQKDTGGSARPTAQQLAAIVFSGPGSGGVLGPGGLGPELTGSFGHVVSANGNGPGGWSLRGNGSGGAGGDPALIGAIATSGTAKRGDLGQLCGGPGPCKQRVEPTIVTEAPFSCTPDGSGAVSCMDKDLIRKVIASHRDQVRFCYELALQESPALAGKVAVFFAVGQGGAVEAARVAQDTAGSAKLSECLTSRVRTWQFPVGRGSGGYRVTYPFLFKPSGT